MSPKVVDKKEKKDQIMAAALQVFAKKGFAKTTINDIANAAGIGKGTVYEYFSNKEEIINNSFMFFVRHMELGFQEILIQEIPAKEKLIRILEGFSHAMGSDSLDLLELMFDYWSEGIKNRDAKGLLLGEMNKFYHSYREIFADVIIEGMSDGSFKKNINPRSVASMIVGTLDGILVQWILDRNGIDLQDIVKTITLTVLNGITAEGN
ncbi:MAG: TetR/AcrR family transcriptional regulator [bacterium]|nr:TetR/AcrR family transcriptional regulator [bacterium]